MSSSRYFSDNGQSEPESVTLADEAGRLLECYVEQKFDINNATYLLLLPLDTPISIIAWEDEEDEAEAILLEEDGEIDRVFADAKAVLAEQNLTLKRTAYTPTVSGELPEVEEEDILTLEIEEENQRTASEEFQFLASFFHEEEEYGIYTPLEPLLFFAEVNANGSIRLLSPEEFKRVQPLLEEWLFDDIE